MKHLIMVLLAFAIIGCSSDNQELIGKWQMHKVIQSGVDVSEEHNPNNDRIITIYADSTFETNGTPFGKNMGKYKYDNVEMTLFLDSDAGPEDDSQWKVRFSEDTMYWQGFGTEWADEFELIHIRIE